MLFMRCRQIVFLESLLEQTLEGLSGIVPEKYVISRSGLKSSGKQGSKTPLMATSEKRGKQTGYRRPTWAKNHFTMDTPIVKKKITIFITQYWGRGCYDRIS